MSLFLLYRTANDFFDLQDVNIHSYIHVQKKVQNSRLAIIHKTTLKPTAAEFRRYENSACCQAGPATQAESVQLASILF